MYQHLYTESVVQRDDHRHRSHNRMLQYSTSKNTTQLLLQPFRATSKTSPLFDASERGSVCGKMRKVAWQRPALLNGGAQRAFALAN
eukprot:1361406-Amphidinium_carterae.1